jgi:hypothetical protein
MKYSINQRVEIKHNSKIVTINDFEVFDSLILYYTSDKSAYSEDELNPEGYSFFTNFVFMGKKEKNKLMKKAIKKHFKKH